MAVAGVTDHDASDAALAAIMLEWTRSDGGFAVRVGHLKNGGGRNETVVLNNDTVHDDAAADVLTGSKGQDWFLFTSTGDSEDRDRTTDMRTFEEMFAEDIEFLASA